MARQRDYTVGPLRRDAILLTVPMVSGMFDESVLCAREHIPYFPARQRIDYLPRSIHRAAMILDYTSASGLSFAVTGFVVRRAGEGSDTESPRRVFTVLAVTVSIALGAALNLPPLLSAPAGR